MFRPSIQCISTIITSLFISSQLLGFADILSTQIQGVTVYPNGATIVRNGSVYLEKGMNQVELKNLPLSLDESSISIFLSKDNILLSQKMHKEYLDYEKIKSKYQLRIINLKDSIEWLNVQTEVLGGQEKLLNENRKLSGEESSFTTSELSQLNTYYGEEMIRIKQEQFALKLTRRELSERLSRLQLQMNQEGRQKSKGQVNIVMDVDAKDSGIVTIQVEYFVPNAGWTPSYDLRMNGLNEDLSIIYKASVFQNTGEDWEDIQLSLSTAEPNRDYTLPTLNPYYLDNYYAVRAQKSSRSMNTDKEMSEVMTSGAIAYSDEVMQEAIPSVLNETYTSFDYEIDLPYTILSTGEGQSVMLKSEKVKVKYQYITMPKISNYAYLTAQLLDWQDLNFVNGEANIFIENRYSGKTFIHANQSTEQFTLSLGKDDDIIVSRELQKGYKKTKFIGGNKEESRIWDLKIKNTKSSSIDIQIMDQYPISQNGEIKVDLGNKGGAESNDESKGILKWSENIKPKSEWTTTIEYRVKYPKDWNLFIN